MLVITSYFGFEAFQTVGKLINNEHSYFVFPMMVVTALTLAMGFLANVSLQSETAEWNTADALANKKWHVIPAYSLLASGFFALNYGMYYYRTSPKHYSDFPLEIYNGAFFVLLFLGAELWHQYTIKDEQPFVVESKKMMSVEDFQSRIAKGDKLVLLDDMVLDMGPYIDKHPGGRFAMQANIGRDVSKYFYGGYALENINPVKPHKHSNDARRLV